MRSGEFLRRPVPDAKADGDRRSNGRLEDLVGAGSSLRTRAFNHPNTIAYR